MLDTRQSRKEGHRHSERNRSIVRQRYRLYILCHVEVVQTNDGAFLTHLPFYDKNVSCLHMLEDKMEPGPRIRILGSMILDPRRIGVGSCRNEVSTSFNAQVV